jgi:hypothetical protein
MNELHYTIYIQRESLKKWVTKENITSIINRENNHNCDYNQQNIYSIMVDLGSVCVKGVQGKEKLDARSQKTWNAWHKRKV